MSLKKNNSITPKKPANSPKVGPVRKKGPQRVKGNPVRSDGGIFGNPFKRGK